MFIEIKPHKGMWVEKEAESIYQWENCRLNLNLVKAIYFDKPEDFDKPEEFKRDGELIINVITFMIPSNETLSLLEIATLYFSKEGEGEFQRIRRIIDKNTFK